MSRAASTPVSSAKRDLAGLTPGTLEAISEGRPGYTAERGEAFLRFQTRLADELLNHRVICANPYTAWFSKGEQSPPQIKAFIVQFSVFSNQFLIAQLNKMINADTLEGMRASKEILANELGVTFIRAGEGRSANARPQGFDPDHVGTEGSVQGGIFHFEAGHFEWLWTIARHLQLGYDQMGHRRNGTPATLFFCDELIRLYGGENYEVSQAASYAVENWAAAGFWRELINTNSEYYGGTGLGNDGGRNTEDLERDGFSQSIRVTLPPLSAFVFKWSGGQ